jgi:hypothetical protein
MPFANLTTEWRLGIANASLPDAFRWAREVLRLSIQTYPQAFPVYQGQMVHRAGVWEQGSMSAAAEQCWDATSDSEYGLANVIRQASAFDTHFSKRNITSGVNIPPVPRKPPKSTYALTSHSANLYAQAYYVQNEPEADSTPLWLPDTTEYCGLGESWLPRNNTIDLMIDTLNAIAYGSWWDGYPSRHVKPQALALAFLRIKRITESLLQRGHTVIPPPPSAPMLGAFGDAFWVDFYNAVRDGVDIPAPIYGQPNRLEHENGVPPKNLKVIHAHLYSAPRDPPAQGNLPLETVAEGAYALKKGVDWYRQQYNPGQPLDMDVLVSEMGADWRISLVNTFSKHKWAWAGGWNNLRDGLSWWNTWLCWLMRRSTIASELNLANCPSGTKTDAHALYACIHSADLQPYSTTFTNEPEVDANGNLVFDQNGVQKFFWKVVSARNQWYFNSDTWTNGVAYNAECIDVTYLSTVGRYQRSFSSFLGTLWDSNSFWRIGPLGACYKVWSQVATDLNTATFGAGWFGTGASGVIGETTVDLPGGYSTVYFPVIKSFGTFAAGTRFNVTWRKSGKPDYQFGYFEPSEFPDSRSITQIWSDVPGPYGQHTIPAQTIYSSMIFPVVCYSATPQTITVRLSRNIGGTSVSLGRPVVLRHACSWLTNQ